MILASCGGQRNLLGVSNFSRIMNHMNSKQKEESENEFDSGRDSDDD
jgi:hypothetical protein